MVEYWGVNVAVRFCHKHSYPQKGGVMLCMFDVWRVDNCVMGLFLQEKNKQEKSLLKK